MPDHPSAVASRGSGSLAIAVLGGVAVMLAVIGVLLPPAFTHSGTDRRRAVIAFVPVSIIGVGAVGAVYAVFNAVLG
jgi:hypothetical protein